jgi:peptidoglycan/xylan/chitin deacetylase (PgdA/CDA1 family)
VKPETREQRLSRELGVTGSLIVDERGEISHAGIRARYDRICARYDGRNGFERVASAESYLRLALRLERRHGIGWTCFVLGVELPQKTGVAS